MPQFDVFSFFSQIFWVFFNFVAFYILLSLFLLPALSTILKIRKRKLVQTGTNDKSGSTLALNTSITNQTNTFFADISSKLYGINANQPTFAIKQFGNLFVKFETYRELKIAILTKIQLITIL